MRDSPPILVRRCSDGWVASHMTWSWGRVRTTIPWWSWQTRSPPPGPGDVLVGSDQEPSILALRDEASAKAKRKGVAVHTE
eukprot:9560667-Prorocentrum_lima.AAC.1